MVNFQHRFLFITIILLVLSHLSLQAQHRVGVQWEVPEDDKTAVAQLTQFDSLGISILEVESKLSPQIWQKIDSLNFEVYGNLGIRFPRTSTFSQPDSLLIKTIQQKATSYLSQSSVTALGLFEYGATHKPNFFTAVKAIANQLKQSGQQKLYYTTRNPVRDDSLINFAIFEAHITPKNLNSLSLPKDESINGYLYHPNKDLANYLAPFKSFFDAIPNGNHTIFLHSDWLITTVDTHPRFADILGSITKNPEPIFPLPKEDVPSSQTAPLPIIILLTIWGTIAWHYNGSPLYRKSLFRYFSGHKFFIDDIFDRHIRSPFPAVTIILQNALLIAACVFSTFLALFSDLGQTALFHHFSAFAIVGSNPLSIFVWAFLGSLIISFINILWLFFAHRKISSLTQVATIYAWPLQINFISCGIAITLFAAGASHHLVTTFTILAILLVILSFVFMSLDTYRFAKSKALHLLKTSVPYLLFWIGITVWILTKNQWMDVISLALNLK